MKCLCVVVCRFSWWNGVGAQSVLFPGGFRSRTVVVLQKVFHPELLFMITVCSCFWRSAFSSCSFVSVQTSMMSSSKPPFFGEPRDEVISGSSLWDVFVCVQLEIDKCRCFAECLPYILFTSASPPACCDCCAIRRIACGPCIELIMLWFVIFTWFSVSIWILCSWCEIRKIQIVCSCVFELCVGSTGFRMFTILRFLRWRLFPQKFFQKLRLNVIFFGWCFWFVWLVCWSVCCVTGDVSDEFISHSFVAEWREEIIFGLFLLGVCSQWEWQVSPNARPLSSSVLAFWLFFRFFTSLSCFWRAAASSCLFVQLHASTASSSNTFCRQHHHRFISLRRHLSVRVLSATERLQVVVRACSIKCCDGCAACSIVWEWACPPSGTVFHVMLGDIRKHVFLRQWGWCEGWIILQVWSECVAWSVWALCQEVFLVRRYESAIIVYFQVGSARNGGFFLMMFSCSRSRFMFRSSFWRSSCSFVSVHASGASSSNTFLSEAHGTRSFLVLPSEMFCVFSWWELAGASVPWSDCHFLVRQCKPTSVLWLQRNASDCAWAMCWASCLLSRLVSADLDDVVFQLRRIMRNL